MGKLIAIDGLDGSGKGTQSTLLYNRLLKIGKKAKLISFPQYETIGATFVNMYLRGELGKNPNDTNAYAASSFYAIDRYISYRTDWINDYYDKNVYIIADRYSTANAVHQLSKLPHEEWNSFLDWLWDYEFEKLALPVPDDILYLEMTPELSIQLVNERCEKTGQQKDIHELDESHIINSYEAALYASRKLHWQCIKCYNENSTIRTPEEIHNEILKCLNIPL